MGSNGLPTTSHHLYPPFPEDLDTAPLVPISLARLESKIDTESEALFEASKDLGFFYLDLQDSDLGRSIVTGAERLKDIQDSFYSRPQSEKSQYAREQIDPFFGYRRVELPIVKADNVPVLIETYNLRKDDFVGNRKPLPCHPLISQNWEIFQSYIRSCHKVVHIMLEHLENHLQLPEGSLTNLHRLHKYSGDHVRFNQAGVHSFSETFAKAGEHTDFGSLTILMNWLGGLQIRPPNTEQWIYVKPIPGFAIVNLGDALVKFTAGILRSNVHRVVPPPPPQDSMVRNSLVYFARPEDNIVLKRLKGGIIDRCPEIQAEKEEPEITAAEWILRRSVGDLKGIYTIKGGLEARR